MTRQAPKRQNGWSVKGGYVRNRALVICGLAMMMAGAREARGAFVASIDFTSGTVISPNIDASIGYAFTVGGAPVSVVSLGLHVTAPSAVVRIYEFGTIVNLASATIDGSDPLSGDGRYRYETLGSPLLLSAGTTYTLLADVSGSYSFYYLTTGIITAPGLTFGGGISQIFSTGGFPSGDAVGSGPFFGPSLEIQTPEPATGLLLAAGASALLARRRRGLSG